MDNSTTIKNTVREKYTAIANQSKDQNISSCCGATGCGDGKAVYTIMADEYKGMEGYNPDADLGLGCGGYLSRKIRGRYLFQHSDV